MNKTRKQIGLNLIASVVSFAVNVGISFLLTPFVVERIGSEAYGFAGLAGNFTNYASILTTALNSMAGRFITISLNRGKKEDAAKYISSVFAANLAMAIPLSIIGCWIIVNLNRVVHISEELIPSVQILWAFLFGGFLLSLVTGVFKTATFARNRLELSSAVSIASSALSVVILLAAFLCFQPKIWYMGLSSFLCTVFTATTSYLLFIKLLPEIRIQWDLVELKKISVLISSGIWNSISRISSIMSEELDLLITNLFVSAPAMGLVSIAKALPRKLLSFFVLFGNAFTPQITINYGKGEYEAVKDDLISAIRLVSFCAGIPLACLYVMGQDFFRLWVPGQNAVQLQTLTILACLEFPLVVPYEPMWNVLFAANKTKQSAIFAIVLAIMSTVTTFVLLYHMHTEFQKMCVVVGVSSCYGWVRGGLYLPLSGAECLRLKWTTFYPVLFKSLCSLLVGVVIAYGIKQILPITGWATLIGDVVLLSVAMTLVNFYLLLSPRERTVLAEKLKKIKSNIG